MKKNGPLNEIKALSETGLLLDPLPLPKRRMKGFEQVLFEEVYSFSYSS